jgi:hypothetical protein
LKIGREFLGTVVDMRYLPDLSIAPGLLIPAQAARHNEMMSPAVTE